MQNERDVDFTPAPDMDQATRGVNAGSSGTLGGAGLDNVADRAEDVAHDVAERARNVAGEVRHRAADEVQARLSDQKHRAADSLGNVADSLRTASRQLGDNDGMSQYMIRAANQVDHLAEFLNNREMADLFGEVEDFARRQPAVFIGGAFALGVLGARFLKSSRRNLIDDGVRDHWSTDQMTQRVPDPTRDAVSRPAAPGYATPAQRGDSDFRAPGSF